MFLSNVGTCRASYIYVLQIAISCETRYSVVAENTEYRASASLLVILGNPASAHTKINWHATFFGFYVTVSGLGCFSQKSDCSRFRICGKKRGLLQALQTK